MKYCQECEQRIRYARKHHITKELVMMLKIGGQYVKDNGINDVPLQIFKGDMNNYDHFQQLRYFGLVHYLKNKETGKRIAGHWLITRNGWAFLRGELELPKSVWVLDNRIRRKSEETVYMQDVWNECEYMQTDFEYFDDDGNSVGIRPNTDTSRQGSLL